MRTRPILVRLRIDGISEVEILAQNLEAPWPIAVDSETPLMSERDTGRILELDANGNTREAGVVEQAAASRGKGGLFGIAMHENQLYSYLTTGYRLR